MTAHVKIAGRRPTSLDRLLARSVGIELDRAYDRVQVNAKLAAWLTDLSARIEKQKIALAYGDLSCDPRDLQREFEQFKLAVALHKERRLGGDDPGRVMNLTLQEIAAPSAAKSRAGKFSRPDRTTARRIARSRSSLATTAESSFSVMPVTTSKRVQGSCRAKARASALEAEAGKLA